MARGWITLVVEADFDSELEAGSLAEDMVADLHHWWDGVDVWCESVELE
jgi:hypothetical protein